MTSEPEKIDREAADIMIGEFIARWDDAADGVTMDADTAQELAREFKRMRGLIYCPGILACAKCGFRLNKTALTLAGAFADDSPDTCPNCNVPMWKTTWSDEAHQAYKVAESQMNRALEKEKALAAATAEIERLKGVIEPVRHWYESDEHPPRSDIDIVADIVADLQTDRAENLKLRRWMDALLVREDVRPETKVLEIAKARQAYFNSKNAMDASTFHGRNRTEELLQKWRALEGRTSMTGGE